MDNLAESNNKVPRFPSHSTNSSRACSWLVQPLLLVLLVAVACDRSTPTQPEPPPLPQASNIVFADPQALADHRATITSLLQDTLERAKTALPVGAVQITVFADPPRAIPGWGLSGYAPSASEIEIVVDPGYSGLAQILPERLPRSRRTSCITRCAGGAQDMA